MKQKVLPITNILFLLVVLINVCYLDWVSLQSNGIKEQPASPVTISKVVSQPPVVSCPQSCLDLISQATGSVKNIPAPIVTQLPSQIIYSGSKNVSIALGIGSSDSQDWLDLAGIETYLDSSKYPGIKEAHFEASLRIPSGNGQVSARLYNVTDKHPVWNSEVASQGATGRLVTSAKINFDSGNKLYRVQMSSSMGYQSFLDNSRITITLE